VGKRQHLVRGHSEACFFERLTCRGAPGDGQFRILISVCVAIIDAPAGKHPCTAVKGDFAIAA